MNNTDLVLTLTHERAAIIEAATDSIRHAATRYDAVGSDETERRLEALYDKLLDAVARRELSEITRYAQELAAERFQSGYDLSDVQVAINALEEAAWTRLCARLHGNDLAVPLGLVSTVLGATKDALAREYVALASSAHVPALDMTALFAGG